MFLDCREVLAMPLRCVWQGISFIVRWVVAHFHFVHLHLHWFYYHRVSHYYPNAVCLLGVLRFIGYTLTILLSGMLIFEWYLLSRSASEWDYRRGCLLEMLRQKIDLHHLNLSIHLHLPWDGQLCIIVELANGGVLRPHVFGTIYSAGACLLIVFSILSVVKDWVRQVGAQNITL